MREKFQFVRSLTVLMSMVLLFATKASARRCADSFYDVNKILRESDFEDIMAMGIGRRGFITGRKLDPKINARIIQSGGMNWNLWLHFAESVNHALKLQRELHNMYDTYERPFLDSAFIIDPDGSFQESLSHGTQPNGHQVAQIRKLAEAGKILYFKHSDYSDGASPTDKSMKGYDHGAGTVEPISYKDFVRHFDPSSWTYNKNTVSPKESRLEQVGVTLPHNKGVFFTEGFSVGKKGQSFREAINRARGQGLRVEFSTNSSNPTQARNFKASLEKAANQTRLSGATSRFASPAAQTKTLTEFKQGKAISADVRSPEGELLGGALVFIHQSSDGRTYYDANTVFYEPDIQPHKSKPGVEVDKGIEYAKLAIAAIIDRLGQSGIAFLDAGMVTSFTYGLGGVLIPPKEFSSLVDSLPDSSSSSPDFVRDWLPGSSGGGN